VHIEIIGWLVGLLAHDQLGLLVVDFVRRERIQEVLAQQRGCANVIDRRREVGDGDVTSKSTSVKAH
jgi:hypothetical protein